MVFNVLIQNVNNFCIKFLKNIMLIFEKKNSFIKQDFIMKGLNVVIYFKILSMFGTIFSSNQ